MRLPGAGEAGWNCTRDRWRTRRPPRPSDIATAPFSIDVSTSRTPPPDRSRLPGSATYEVRRQTQYDRSGSAGG